MSWKVPQKDIKWGKIVLQSKFRLRKLLIFHFKFYCKISRSFPVQGHMSKGSKIMVTFDFTPKFGYPTIEMKINVNVA